MGLTTRRPSSSWHKSTIVTDTSRGVEGPGPTTLRQPTERHGGNARNDEEVTVMVSKAIASLDAWLAQAEELLRTNMSHEDRLVLATFDLARRESTPASQRIANADEDSDAASDWNDSTVQASFRSTTEPWAPYYRSVAPISRS